MELPSECWKNSATIQGVDENDITSCKCSPQLIWHAPASPDTRTPFTPTSTHIHSPKNPSRHFHLERTPRNVVCPQQAPTTRTYNSAMAAPPRPGPRSRAGTTPRPYRGFHLSYRTGSWGNEPPRAGDATPRRSGHADRTTERVFTSELGGNSARRGHRLGSRRWGDHPFPPSPLPRIGHIGLQP